MDLQDLIFDVSGVIQTLLVWYFGAGVAFLLLAYPAVLWSLCRAAPEAAEKYGPLPAAIGVIFAAVAAPLIIIIIKWPAFVIQGIRR